MSRLKTFLRWLPLSIMVLALVLIIYFRLYDYFSFHQLKQHHQALVAWTDQHYLIAVLLFMTIYIVAVAISIPGATILTITGGFLFGYLGTVYVVISASMGATILFLAVKTTLGRWLQQKAVGWVNRMEKGFQKNALNYLLFLRLIPIFPFWVVNIVPALLGVRLYTFFIATSVGIIPGSFVYVSVGTGLDSIFISGKTPHLNIIFEPQILLPILALAFLSLLPVLYKKIKKTRYD